MPCIALLGRKDEPTDAVEEYCRYLAAALQAHDIQLEIRRVPWEIDGWQTLFRRYGSRPPNGATLGCWFNTLPSHGPYGGFRRKFSVR